jgi:hypothetical protein
MNASNARRGNAVPETALTMGLVLLLLLGVVKLTLVGYEQAEADGAAFVAARAASLSTVATTQVSRGETHAESIFTRIPTANIGVTSGSSGGPNGTGEVVGSAYRLTAGLFGGSFGSGSFDLKSHIVEPVIDGTAFSSTVPMKIAASNLLNCVSANPATPTCSAAGLPIYLPVYDPTNKNPWWQFQCHEATYAVLSNGTSGTGTVGGAHPWPEDYQPTTDGSINWPAVRASGLYLNVNGTLGTLLTPMYSATAANPCG